ncbi:MAG: copper resistance system multicopper oxidase [Gammaproteobacteria bacterium]|nr:copper resistance system multicopper oxidase [Gammaproteobacteria bacterium]
MSIKRSPAHRQVSKSRRRFVLGTLSAGALAVAGRALADGGGFRPGEVLSGNVFDLEVGYRSVNFTGREGRATVVNGALPAPVLRWKEGDRVRLRVTNRLAVDTSIHWHGIVLPEGMDGVPGLSFPGIRPGEAFEYSFQVRQSGTYWYHSHSHFQEQTGVYGPIVIEPLRPEPYAYDRDYVVMLSDWSDETPEAIFARLKKHSEFYNRNPRTAGDLWREVRDKGVSAAWRDRAMWNEMRMSDRDLSDVTGATYTFLMNGRTPAEGWTGLFRPGEKLRLRFINGSAMTFFDVRIPGLKMTVIAADGQHVESVTVDEFRIGVAETYDVLVEPEGDVAYTVFAQAIDRSGYARGLITPDPALGAEVPALDPPPRLTHADMGMAHDMGHDADAAQAMDHGAHAMSHDEMNMDMEMDMEGMAGMDHAMHESPDAMPAAPEMGSGKAGQGSSRPLRHPRSERGPQVDMQAAAPRYRLEDPGPGLRDNGRRVLTYADLRNLSETPDPREPGREIELHLTGNMSRYMWSIDGIPFAAAEPLRFTYGERLRITLVNDTMMNHPIHLHGMWSDLETGDGDYIPRKHTVIVQPGSKLSYLVTADARGRWAYHCHLLYHMMGMFREVQVG